MTSLPAELGRYQVAGLLATGGMAEVLLGRDTGPHGFERPVVIKRILPHLARDPMFVAMFLDEARIVATIRHNNVVQVHELVQHGSELALIMEYLEGESTDVLLRRLAAESLRLPYALAAHVIAEACAGLHAAHELSDGEGNKRQLVHRDVTPHNLFVTYDGQVKVIDFGIALAAGRSSKTETGHIKGKFAYMSPEQCSGEALDRRSDIFSLGVVLFELATGHRAFKRATDLLTMRAICEDPVVRPSDVIESFPVELEAVIIRALSREAGDRYASAADMRRELLVAIRSLPLDDAPDAALGSLMEDVFAQEISDKRRLLQRVAQGGQLDSAPVDEDKDDTVVPIALGGEPTRTASAVWATGTKRPARPSRRLYALLALAAAVLGGTVLFVRVPDAATRAISFAELVPTVASPIASNDVGANTVELVVRSVPSGAEVQLDGDVVGVTPLRVELRAVDAARRLRVIKRGYEPFVDEVRLTADQILQLQLKLETHPATAPPRTTTTAPKAVTSSKPEREFHGFD